MASSSEAESDGSVASGHLSEEDEEFPISEDEEMQEIGKSGWAQAMQKVIKSKSEGVLSKVKKTEVLTTQKKYGFEIDGEVQEEETPEETPEKKKKVRERREVRSALLKLRVRPDVTDREREKTLQKVATRGLVQLFNAIRAQQKDIDEKLEQVGKPQYKRDKFLKTVQKKTFIDALMSGSRAKSELVDNPVKKEPKREKRQKEEHSDDEDDGSHKRMWTALKEEWMANSKWDDDE